MSRRSVLNSVVALACVSIVHAKVVIETVTVDNPGNAGELSGTNAAPLPDGSGPNRICGSVEYIYNIGKFEATAALAAFRPRIWGAGQPYPGTVLIC